MISPLPLPLLSPTPPGAMYPGLGSPVQDAHGHVGEGPEKGYKNGQRAVAPLL